MSAIGTVYPISDVISFNHIVTVGAINTLSKDQQVVFAGMTLSALNGKTATVLGAFADGFVAHVEHTGGLEVVKESSTATATVTA